jgi:hypothetical protein
VLCRYSESSRDHAEHVNTVKEWLADASSISNPSVAVICSLVLMNEGHYDIALRACHGGGTPELQSLKVQALLRMNRPDIAWSELQQLQKLEVRVHQTEKAIFLQHLYFSLTLSCRTTRA